MSVRRRNALAGGAVFAVSAAALLFAFERVVQHGVQQGSERRSEALFQAGAAGHCGTTRGRQARDDCVSGRLSQRTAPLRAAP